MRVLFIFADVRPHGVSIKLSLTLRQIIIRLHFVKCAKVYFVILETLIESQVFIIYKNDFEITDIFILVMSN